MKNSALIFICVVMIISSVEGIPVSSEVKHAPLAPSSLSESVVEEGFGVGKGNEWPVRIIINDGDDFHVTEQIYPETSAESHLDTKYEFKVLN